MYNLLAIFSLKKNPEKDLKNDILDQNAPLSPKCHIHWDLTCVSLSLITCISANFQSFDLKLTEYTFQALSFIVKQKEDGRYSESHKAEWTLNQKIHGLETVLLFSHFCEEKRHIHTHQPNSF